MSYTALADTFILWNFIIEKTSLSGVSFREEMFSTSEIDVVETTIALTSLSTSQAALNEASKIHGKMIMISDFIMRIRDIILLIWNNNFISILLFYLRGKYHKRKCWKLFCHRTSDRDYERWNFSTTIDE